MKLDAIPPIQYNHTTQVSPKKKNASKNLMIGAAVGTAIVSAGTLAAYFVVRRRRAMPQTGLLPNPIAFADEFKSIIEKFSDKPQAYSPGKVLNTAIKDGFDLSGMENGTFRVNLHLHTTHSDGRMTVRELLNSATEYANKIAAKVKDDYPPFTVAITDHDTVAGCKEAMRIIECDPEKYKNLKVVCGCELSTQSQIIPQQLKKPFSVHLLLQGIDPFDEKLNKFLSTKEAARKAYLGQLFDALNKESRKESFTIEEAETLYPHLKVAYTNRMDLVKEYIKAKCTTRPTLVPRLNEICKEFRPKLERQDAYMDLRDTMEFIKTLDQGYMVIGHPGLTGIGQALKKPEESMAAMDSLFKAFKEIGGERALGAEQHYHYYGSVVQDNPNWLRSIESFIEKHKLIKTGGLDSHGKRFYYSGK